MLDHVACVTGGELGEKVVVKELRQLAVVADEDDAIHGQAHGDHEIERVCPGCLVEDDGVEESPVRVAHRPGGSLLAGCCQRP